MTATLRIFTERKDNVLRVSNAALRWRPPGEAKRCGAGPAAACPQSFFGRAAAGRAARRGQNAGQQMLERLATELKLDEAQKRELDAISRDVRQAVAASGAAETPMPGGRRAGRSPSDRASA